MDDMAEGVKAPEPSHFDKDRVGIHGSSYGGYSAAMEILRHPDVFAAAFAASPPTDWRNYDTIYRALHVDPRENGGYDAGRR
jgi:dipeptidyl-peptidase-4